MCASILRGQCPKPLLCLCINSLSFGHRRHRKCRRHTTLRIFTRPNWPSRRMEQINFQMLYDRDGGSFPVENKNTRVDKLEVFRDGKMYNLPKKLAD